MDLHPTEVWHDGYVELFVLRPEHVSEQYVGWLNDPEVNRYLESRFVTHDIASTRTFVQNCLDSDATLMFGIRARFLDGRHVGNIKIGPIDRRHGLGEVGVLIGDKGAWGKGVAAAAIERTASIAREELGLRKLTAGCYASNAGSERAFVKAGFIVEGRRKDHFLCNGVSEDLVLMARFL